MDKTLRRGSLEMTAAMLISGTIGWFVLVSGLPVLDVVFWRCVFGAVTLLLICAGFGFLRPGILTRTTFLLAVLSGVAIVGNWVLLFASYSRASIAIGTAVYNVQPFMLVGLAALFLGRKSPRKNCSGWRCRFSECWPSSVPMVSRGRAAVTICWASHWHWGPRCCTP